MVPRRVTILYKKRVTIVKNFKFKVKEQIWEKKNKRLHECSKGRNSLNEIADKRWRRRNSLRLIWQDIRTRTRWHWRRRSWNNFYINLK